MKKITLLFLTACLFSIGSHAQNDTLVEEDLFKLAETVYGKLNPNLFGEALMNRAFSSSDITNRQLKGDYNQKHSIIEFFELYQDVAAAQTDSKRMMSTPELAKFLMEEFSRNENYSKDDVLIQPFGLLLHEMSYIDDSKFTNPNFGVNNHTYVPLNNELQLYDKAVFKSATLIEFYPESGYRTGYLKYTPELINTSSKILNLKLRINVGNGFVDFSPSNPLISYNRTADSLTGQVEMRYEQDGEQITDILTFYLTTKGESANKSNYSYWQYVTEYETDHDITFDIGNLLGCDNTVIINGARYARRPIIIVPPYRPSIQPFSMQKYFDQFNVDDYFNKLVEKGYDVLFIKLKPGNASLEQAADALIQYIKMINENKKIGYPNEDWENIISGYSMGGQIARYALKKMEKQHMDQGTAHHHTRLYIPFDSPHLGANIPMFTQLVYKELRITNILATLAYESLIDEASKDMGIAHVHGSTISNPSGNTYNVYPGITSERASFVNDLENNFNHQFTQLNDMRRTFPTFTRNVAVSTGHNTQDYEDLYQMNPGKLLFDQNAIGYGLGGLHSKHRRVYASKYAADHTVFRIKDRIIQFLIPITIKDKDYRVQWSKEYDLAQGGYKDEFYDKFPTGVTAILRSSAFGLGQKYYNGHSSFLPLVSALAINPAYWSGGSLTYNLKTNGLMFNQFDFIINQDESDLYGYPNLGQPVIHFRMTPFEAIYADPLTYEHIKLQASVDDNNYDASYLATTTRFLLDEVEAEEVFMQNKVIGDNHLQSDPSYRYKAWYKAARTLCFGELVTPKTDKGPYVIKNTGIITAYAGVAVVLKPGFHTQPGSVFHAYIEESCPPPPGIAPQPDEELAQEWIEAPFALGDSEKETASLDEQNAEIELFPNPSSGIVTLRLPPDCLGTYEICSLSGPCMQQAEPKEAEIELQLQPGVYFFRFTNKQGQHFTRKLIVL